jgi:LysW-gamma-L-lysine carboxypeptidase
MSTAWEPDAPASGPDDAWATALLEEMVATPSLSGREGAVASLLVRRMAEVGLRSFVDEAGNAIGIAAGGGTGAPLDIMLLGHMDTVPGGPRARRVGDTLWGRGAVDAKGPLAAFVAAAARACLPEGVRVVVAGAVEEEAPSSRGARHVAGAYAPAACVIGEPGAWDGVVLGYKGRVVAMYRGRRGAVHSASPAPSPADLCCEWWQRVRAAAEGLRTEGRVFDRVQATLLDVRTRRGRSIDTVEARASFRIPPGVTPEDIRTICRGTAGGATVEFTGEERAFVADRGNAVARALRGAIRDAGGTPTLKVKTGTSDMNVVGPAWGCPIAAYGPGDSTLDHTAEERISIPEFLRSVRVLTGAIERLAGELAASAVQGLACGG